MAEITQRELDICHDVLEKILAKTRREEPYAVNFIRVLEAVVMELPIQVEDLSIK